MNSNPFEVFIKCSYCYTEISGEGSYYVSHDGYFLDPCCYNELLAEGQIEAENWVLVEGAG